MNRENDMNEYFDFLTGRDGAGDSDVSALEERFSLTSCSAENIYRSWLDTLVTDNE